MTSRRRKHSADLDTRVKETHLLYTIRGDPSSDYVAPVSKLLRSPIHDVQRSAWQGGRRSAEKRKLVDRDRKTSITLTRPLEPPSPTDDPILLVSSSNKRRRNIHIDDRTDRDLSSFHHGTSLGPAGCLRHGCGVDSAAFTDAPISATGDMESPLTSRTGSIAHDESANSTALIGISTLSTLTASPVTKEADGVTTMLVDTKSDPPTPGSRARSAAWGVWGSPWPRRGPDGREGSFRMDGRRLFATELDDSTHATTPGVQDNVEEVTYKGPFDFDFDFELSPAAPHIHSDSHLSTYIRYDARFDFNFQSQP
ncbi:hypothetical protein B0H13DRAFT_2302047 [Mycena leptocephala]|nr:hypothetical protein B0H13DRAFT_2302047 [Mycena leptocephala]